MFLGRGALRFSRHRWFFAARYAFIGLSGYGVNGHRRLFLSFSEESPRVYSIYRGANAPRTWHFASIVLDRKGADVLHKVVVRLVAFGLSGAICSERAEPL